MIDKSPVSPAPGELEFVRRFVNTLNIETGVDSLADAVSWKTWAAGHEVDGEASTAELAYARDVREALRAAMLANHDRSPMPASTERLLTEAASRARFSLRFEGQSAHFTGAGAGMHETLSRVVLAVAAAMNDGTWSRLKACVNDECQWGFYDKSRSRTGQWCSMEICGNRAKQARWRDASARG